MNTKQYPYLQAMGITVWVPKELLQNQRDKLEADLRHCHECDQTPKQFGEGNIEGTVLTIGLNPNAPKERALLNNILFAYDIDVDDCFHVYDQHNTCFAQHVDNLIEQGSFQQIFVFGEYNLGNKYIQAPSLEAILADPSLKVKVAAA